MTQAMQLTLLVGAPLVLVLGGLRLIAAFRARARLRRRLSLFAGLAAPGRELEETPRARAAVAQDENPLRTWLAARYPLSGGGRTFALVVLGALALALAVAAALGFFGLQALFAAPCGAVAGVLTARSLGRALEAAKRTQFEQRFLVAVDDFHRMVLFGIGAQQAMTGIAGAAEAPLQASLHNITHAVELGAELADAMEREARRVRIGELAMLAAILATQARGGGNLAEAVGNLAAMLRERLDNRSRLRAMTAESRVTLIILAVVPFLAIGIQSAMQPELVEMLIGDGRHLLGIGLGMILGGLLIARMMIARAQR